FDASTAVRDEAKAMRPISDFPAALCRKIRLVLTDVDDTLTFAGRLGAGAYDALERLERAGILVIPVTAAPAGWCDLMARMWPVRAVIGENGGLCFSRAGEGRELRRAFWQSEDERARSMTRLAGIAAQIRAAVPEAITAADQPFRQTTWALQAAGESDLATRMAAAWRDAGATATINTLWVMGWLGGFDKLKMALRMAGELLALDLAAEKEAVLYVGDSLNDEPMFRFFPNSVGVSTVTDYRDRLNALPPWVTRGPGGAGFVEVADMLLAGR
ncbi:MAG TPA: HAD-IIB family hydrolase, partial [Stellaceae bacterium]|nr:HAD-IIB family hydrolase [Stellaceae bacterium]